MARRHPFVSAAPPADLYAIKGWTAAAAAAAAADDTLFKISLHISRPSLESGDNCNTVDNDCEVR